MRTQGLRPRKRFLSSTVFIALLGFAARAIGEPIPFIDTHVHLEQQGGGVQLFASDAETALAEMKRIGIEKSLLMAPPMLSGNRNAYDIEELRRAVDGSSKSFAFLGGGGTLNPMIHDTATDAVSESVRKKFRARAEEILAAGAVGFGEIAIEHFSLPRMGPRHPYEAVSADHPLLLLLADIAAEHDVPIDIHFDVVPEDMPLPPSLRSPPNPAQLRQNLPAFERLLAHNRAKIVWAHVGMEPARLRTLELCRELLTRHPNLYMSFRLALGGPHPSMALDGANRLKPGWLALMRDYPDRFTLGSDQFYQSSSTTRRTATEGLDNLRSLVNQLPEELARKVARENALKLYRLKD